LALEVSLSGIPFSSVALKSNLPITLFQAHQPLRSLATRISAHAIVN